MNIKYLVTLFATTMLAGIAMPAPAAAAVSTVRAVVPETDALLTGVATYSTVKAAETVTQADSIAVHLEVLAGPDHPRSHHPVSVALINKQGSVVTQSRTVNDAFGIAQLDISAFMFPGTYRIVVTDENYSIPVILNDQPEIEVIGLPGESFSAVGNTREVKTGNNTFQVEGSGVIASNVKQSHLCNHERRLLRPTVGGPRNDVRLPT